MSAKNLKIVSLLSLLFVSDVAVMAFETLGSKALALTFGNSIFVWGKLIAVLLAGFVGRLRYGRLAGRLARFF